MIMEKYRGGNLFFAHEHLFTIKPDLVGTNLKVRSLLARSACGGIPHQPGLIAL